MLDVLVLGPTEVVLDGERRPLGGPIARALLAVLALRAGQVVHTDVLLEAAWSGAPPPSARHALNVYLSSLRKAVAPAATIERSGPGFRLVPAPDSTIVVDATTFSALGEAAAAELGSTDVGTTRETIDRALALWRGHPFADLPECDEWTIESARLEALHRELLQSRAECRVAVGDLSGIAELRAFAAQDAYDEITQMRLMRALYLAGRQQEALDVFGAYRRRMQNELGLEPSAAIVALERAILNHRLGAWGWSDRPRRSQPIFGREQLIADVCALLTERARVVTLGGMGGIGKTTVAIAVADRLAEAGRLVTWIPAEELSSGDVPARIAQELTGRRHVDPYGVYADARSPRLLVIDGFEGHERHADYLDFLIGVVPSLRVLLTSRRPTHVAAEWNVQVPPLDPPADQVRSLSELSESPPALSSWSSSNAAPLVHWRKTQPELPARSAVGWPAFRWHSSLPRHGSASFRSRTLPTRSTPPHSPAARQPLRLTARWRTSSTRALHSSARRDNACWRRRARFGHGLRPPTSPLSPTFPRDARRADCASSTTLA
jgi:DNA-binding SARP family transcriptional activator